jgi:enolase-phosphatase E1
VREGPRAVLLDIEGTTTPVDFVYKVLFPYAYERLPAWLRAHGREADVVADVEGLRAEHARDLREGREPPPWEDAPDAVAAYARWLMDQDRKATALKSLQGKIWAEGYARGVLRGQVYEDVPRALRRWTEAGRKVAIFSSGSVPAQKLIFGHSDHGDLTGSLAAYFDTTTGPKAEAESYRKIAAALGEEPAHVLFVSDALGEIEAAREAGMQTAQAVRSGARPPLPSHPVVTTFDRLP